MTRLCSVEGCGKPYDCHGYCGMHYRRVKRHGDPHFINEKQSGPTRTFVAAAINFDQDECLLWPFHIGKTGYGRFRVDGKMVLVHRYVCESVHGPSHGLEAAHSCGIGRCVNPKHLRWATPAENAKDKQIHEMVRGPEAARIIGDEHTS